MRKKNGFTLIELMVVIVIMGILASVAVPKLFGIIAKAKVAELLSASGTYIHLQEAYLVQEHGIGSWNDIGYGAPGNGKTHNFEYGNCLQESTLESGVSFIGWYATNLSSLNECGARNAWGIVITPFSKETAYYNQLASTEECAALNSNWHAGNIDVSACTAGSAQVAQAGTQGTNGDDDFDDNVNNDNVNNGSGQGDDTDQSSNVGCEGAKGNGLEHGNKNGFVDLGDCIIQKGQLNNNGNNGQGNSGNNGQGNSGNNGQGNSGNNGQGKKKGSNP